jgi:hypothetical protein
MLAGAVDPEGGFMTDSTSRLSKSLISLGLTAFLLAGGTAALTAHAAPPKGKARANKKVTHRSNQANGNATDQVHAPSATTPRSTKVAQCVGDGSTWIQGPGGGPGDNNQCRANVPSGAPSNPLARSNVNTSDQANVAVDIVVDTAVASTNAGTAAQ